MPASQKKAFSYDASQSWREIRMTPDIWLELELLRREAFGEPSQRIEKELMV